MVRTWTSKRSEFGRITKNKIKLEIRFELCKYPYALTFSSSNCQPHKFKCRNAGHNPSMETSTVNKVTPYHCRCTTRSQGIPRTHELAQN